MGKKLLVKPLRAQLEQLSNALALEQIELGMVMPDLDRASVAYWLQNGAARQVIFPNVAEAVVEWLLAGDQHIDPAWVRSVWDRVVYRSRDAMAPPTRPAVRYA